jgi:hypothetical protein
VVCKCERAGVDFPVGDGQVHKHRRFVITKILTPDEENRLLTELLQKTAARRLRWGFQPPSTVQTNIGNLHYVLGLRKGMYRLTARRDGGKTVQFLIARKADDADRLTQLFQLATQPQTA